MSVVQSVTFDSKGRSLEAVLFPPEEPKDKNPAVFFVHGWTSQKENYFRRAEALARLGYVALAFDLSGQGRSPGKVQDFSRQDHLNDALGAFDFLASRRDVDSNGIGICGVSYGAYLAAIATGLRPMRWLAMRVPALYPDAGFRVPTAGLIDQKPDIFKSWRGQTLKTNKALHAVSRYSGQILLVQSGQDEVIPPQTIEAYVAAADPARLTHAVMPDADHAIYSERWENEFVGILSDWASAQLAEG